MCVCVEGAADALWDRHVRKPVLHILQIKTHISLQICSLVSILNFLCAILNSTEHEFKLLINTDQNSQNKFMEISDFNQIQLHVINGKMPIFEHL